MKYILHVVLTNENICIYDKDDNIHNVKPKNLDYNVFNILNWLRVWKKFYIYIDYLNADT